MAPRAALRRVDQRFDSEVLRSWHNVHASSPDTRTRPRRSLAPQRSRLTKHTILFLAANPVGTDRLALDKEARAIQVALERSGFRDSFELVTRWAAEPLDLLRELRKLKPTIVHFSGHGTSHAAGARGDAEGTHRDVVVQAAPSDLAEHG